MCKADINTLCKFVEEITQKDNNINFPITNNNIGSIISKTSPKQNLSEFIKHIFSYNIIDGDNIKGVVIYTINLINKLKQNGLYLNNLTCHRIVLICLMLSSKLYEDENYLNSVWARISGTTVQNINSMELLILEILDNNLHIILSENQILSIVKCMH